MSSCASCLWYWKARLFASWAPVAGDRVVIMPCGCWAKIQKASLVTQRGTTLGFVDCSTRWHVDIGEWWTLISAARQLTWSYIPWHIPSTSYYWRTSKSVWSSLALCSRQTSAALWGVLSSERLCKYFAISLLHSRIICSVATGMNEPDERSGCQFCLFLSFRHKRTPFLHP